MCEVLAAQQRHLFGRRAAVRTKVWLEAAGLHVFGSGLARLLENVERLGTLRQAAEAADISYRHAWNITRGAEEHLGKVLLVRQAGGRRGGGSVLSADGRHMLEAFKRLDEQVAAYAQRRFAVLFEQEKQCPKQTG